MALTKITSNMASLDTLTANNGVLELDDNGSHNGIINVPASLSINIDSDNGATNETFTISKDKTGINDTDPLFRVTEAGTVGIRTSSPGACLHIDGSGSAEETQDAKLFVTKNTSGDWSIYAAAGSDDYGIRTNGSGNYGLAVYDYPNSAYKFRVNYGGEIFSSSTTVYSISDERLKENVTDANSQWDDIKGLRFVNYEWVDDKYGDGTYLGLIAQEVEQISPNLVEIDAQPKEDIDAGIEDPEYKTVKYSIVWMKAVKALQEAMAKIETLEEKVRTLENT